MGGIRTTRIKIEDEKEGKHSVSEMDDEDDEGVGGDMVEDVH